VGKAEATKSVHGVAPARHFEAAGLSILERIDSRQGAKIAKREFSAISVVADVARLLGNTG
jgi:hypothetical protein